MSVEAYTFPTSFTQRRMWFLHELDRAGSVAYHVTGALRISGALDTVALQRAVDAIFARHDTLRTAYVVEDGEPVQVVVPSIALAIPTIALDALDDRRREAELRRIALREWRRPFDLATVPPLRLTLVRLAGDEHVLLAVVHHIAADHWSMGVFVAELAALYRCAAEGSEAGLPDLPLQYGDFATWQREWLASEELERQLAYWRARLADVPPLELPTDHPRPPLQSFEGATLRRTLAPELVADVDRLARRTRATAFMVLLAAFQAVLGRHAGQEVVAVGTAVANRTRPELEPLIGFFANTLVLRGDLGGDPTFLELVERTRETCLEAYAHQDAPFERLVEDLAPERDLSRNPLFQVMCVMQNTPAQPVELPGLVLAPIEIDPGTSTLDASLTFTPRGESLEAELTYDAALFEPRTAERLLDRYETFVRGAVREPQRPLAELPLLPPAERDVLERWGAGERLAVPDGATLSELAARTVARSPDRDALVSSRGRITFAELDARANRLAHHLRAVGVERGARVAVCLPRTPELLVALLGVMRAGAAYVGLDPSYPPQRLALMLADAGPTAVVTTVELAPLAAGVPAVHVDRDADAIAARPATPLAAVDPDELAYVVYTSGSTGRPKGVAVTHRALVNFVASATRTPGLDASDRLVAVTTLAFDISGYELLAPLASGSTIVLADADAVRDGPRLARLLAESRASVLQTTPSTWRLLLEAGWDAGAGLRALSGGEALDPDLAQRLLATGADVWNYYGPSEATIWATVGRVTRGSAPVPLGAALANTRLHVLDGALRPVPIGVPGELYVAGAGLARGYLGRPDLTAERFVPDPLGPPGGRLYRTGDLVRYTADGVLEFLGRLDHQVKIRGHRVELGEIEALLRSAAGVDDAVVVAEPDAVGDPRLVAYVESGAAGGEVTAALRERLRERLPQAMLPAAYVVLPKLPRTANGKLDRRSLPGADGARPEVGQPFVAPRTATEKRLAAMCAEALELDRVGVYDDFFELGGHSLVAARLLARVRDELGVELPLRRLFVDPTVAHLAEAVDRARDGTVPDAQLDDAVASLSDYELDALLEVLGDGQGVPS
jgi:amino acid adenylation domain-containing protein